MIPKFSGGQPYSGYFTSASDMFGFLGGSAVNNTFSDEHTAEVGKVAGLDKDSWMQVDIVGNSYQGWYWHEGDPQPSAPQLSFVLPKGESVDAGFGSIWAFDGETIVREVSIMPIVSPLREIAVRGRLGTESLEGDLTLEMSPSTGPQAGLLHRWFSIPNPGIYDLILEVFDPLFPEDGERPDVVPFHSEGTWWTGNRQSISGIPSYPLAILDQPRIHDNGKWNASNNDRYTVYLTGEILIPESGTYRFLDGIDNFAAFGIDVNDDGVVDGLDDEFLINDNSNTDLNRQANDGGILDDQIPSVAFSGIPEGGKWFRVEAIVAEGAGGDSGIFYWDYDATDVDGDGIRIGDAMGFPAATKGDMRTVADDDIQHLAIPETHLRSEGGSILNGGDATLQLEDITYRFELGPDGQFDQISVQKPADLFTTKLDLGQAVVQLATLDELNPQDLEPGEYRLFIADDIFGDASLSILDELRDVLDTSRLFTEGILMVLGDSLDCNGDGIVDVRDANCTTFDQLDETLAAAGLVKGDMDGNGSVDFADFLVVANNFAMPGEYTDGDFDKSSQIDFADFLILSNNFSQAVAEVAPVPEPSTNVLAVLVLAGALLHRRTSHAK